jgi:hypothetical protein
MSSLSPCLSGSSSGGDIRAILKYVTEFTETHKDDSDPDADNI